MKTIRTIVLVQLLPLMVWSQSNTWKFDFGGDGTVKGYKAVLPSTMFSNANAFGFEDTAGLQMVRSGTAGITKSCIRSHRPFYFSVVLPDGNYDIKFYLGDKAGTSATTIRVENRRLMLENIRTKKGEITTPAITVHVRDSLIRNDKGNVEDKVRIKPREKDYYHWDNKLTIEFNDSMPVVCGLEITPNTSATTIFLAGNSTVVDQDREPWAAWGQMFPAFLIPGRVTVANYAESGETLKAFQREKRLKKIFSLAKPGDYLFIEFTHNDQKPGGNHLEPFTSYKDTLKAWIKKARNLQIIPVLVTSMHRRNFDATGHIINTLSDYPEAMRQTAKEENVMLIDLNAMSKTLYEAWGEKVSLKAFVHYPANSFPKQPEALADNTHFSPYGAYLLAQCVVSSIQKQQLSLEKFIKKDVPQFDPAHPSSPEKFYWPQSSAAGAVKPDGN